MKVTTMKS